MKTIPLKKAIILLENAAAVIVDDDYVTYPNTSAKGYFLCLARDESAVENGEEETFSAKDNKTVQIDELGRLVLVNEMGDETTVALLGIIRAD